MPYDSVIQLNAHYDLFGIEIDSCDFDYSTDFCLKFQMKDNKFNGEAFIGMMTMKYGGDDAKMKSAQEVVSACSSVQDADRCEAGAKICKCLAENTMSRGL